MQGDFLAEQAVGSYSAATGRDDVPQGRVGSSQGPYLPIIRTSAET